MSSESRQMRYYARKKQTFKDQQSMIIGYKNKIDELQKLVEELNHVIWFLRQSQGSGTGFKDIAFLTTDSTRGEVGE